MEPKTLSASAGLVFENCEARYSAEYIDRTPDLGGSAGNLGSSCHEALEWFVANGHHLAQSPWEVLETYYKIIYYQYFSDTARLAEGLKLLKNWYDRCKESNYWYGREVLSCEVKETFDLKYHYDGQDYVLPVTYIWDRCDSLKDGDEIEVVDYKTVSLPVTPSELGARIQPRVYALAAQIKYPQAKKIWVTYDLLRYDLVGRAFTREDNVATWRYLQQMAARIRASDGTKETLNPECRWCVRKAVCTVLNQHAKVGGILALNDVQAAVDLRAKNDAAIGALKSQMQLLDDYIIEEMMRMEVTEITTPNTIATASIRSQRKVDSERVAPLLPVEVLAKYASLGVTDLDTILKEEDLDDNLKSQIRGMVRKQPGAPYIKTKPARPTEEAE